MKAAALRQLEYERREDRKVQREREEEGDIFNDKESFVTEAYRKRMEEKQRLDEEERKQDQIEGKIIIGYFNSSYKLIYLTKALLDVRKAKNLSGFYDNMLKLRTGELKIEEESEKLERERRERSIFLI
jgi:coiled-coil domain-containing protein 55